MSKASSKIRELIDGLASNEPEMTMLMVALQNHHGGGGNEWGMKPSSQSRHEDGEVRSERELLKAVAPSLRSVLKEIGIDPKTANPCIVAFRTGEGFAISILVVSPGDVEKGEWAGYASYTEEEYFKIANGPKPERYPYAKMPQPIGTVVTIGADGALGEPVRTVPPHMEWFYHPIDWNAVAGIPEGMTVPDPVPTTSEKADASAPEPGSADKKLDPFIMDVVVAIGMQPPGVRDIRRIGIPNGFRDARGNVID